MENLDVFSEWMTQNSGLSESSVYKYKRAVNTVSNDMIEQKVVNKSLLDMNLVELDIAIYNIQDNPIFIEKIAEEGVCIVMLLNSTDII